MATILRCKSRIQGKIRSDGLLEILCKEQWCRDRTKGIVVLHYFNVETGELVKTTKYKDPNKTLEERQNSEHSAS